MFSKMFNIQPAATDMLACAFLTTKDSKKLEDFVLASMGMCLELGPIFRVATCHANRIVDFPESETVWAVPFVYGIRPYVLFVTRFRYQVMPWNFSERPNLDKDIMELWGGICHTTACYRADFDAACQVAEGYFDSVPDKTKLVFFGVRPGGTNIIPVRM